MKIKEIKNLEESLYKFDEDGRCIIDVVVNDEDSILSSFSGNDPTISNEFSEYIENKTTIKHIKNQLTINIICDTIDEKEEVLYREAIKNNYILKYLESRKEMIRDFIIAGAMLLVGILVLILAVILELNGKNNIILEIYDIIAWVFVWEATDIVFFKRTITNLKRKKYYCLMNAKVNYKKKTQ